MGLWSKPEEDEKYESMVCHICGKNIWYKYDPRYECDVCHRPVCGNDSNVVIFCEKRYRACKYHLIQYLDRVYDRVEEIVGRYNEDYIVCDYLWTPVDICIEGDEKVLEDTLKRYNGSTFVVCNPSLLGNKVDVIIIGDKTVCIVVRVSDTEEDFRVLSQALLADNTNTSHRIEVLP